MSFTRGLRGVGDVVIIKTMHGKAERTGLIRRLTARAIRKEFNNLWAG